MSWKWYAAILVAAMLLFLVFLMTQFDPIDRPAMLGVSVMCVGLTLLIIGTITAVGKFGFEQDSPTETGLNALAFLAIPRRRFGEFFYSRSAPYVFFEKILIAIILPLGFVFTFLRPRQTWPSILWVCSGLLTIGCGILFCLTMSR